MGPQDKAPRGATWWVINSGEIFVTGEAQQDPHIGPAGKRLGFNSLLSIPIKVGEETIGVIHFISYQRDYFDPQKVAFLSAIANQITVATAQSQLYEEIRKGRDFLGALLTSSADAIIATDPEGKITFFSREAEKMLGYEAEEVLGQPLEMLISGGQRNSNGYGELRKRLRA